MCIRLRAGQSQLQMTVNRSESPRLIISKFQKSSGTLNISLTMTSNLSLQTSSLCRILFYDVQEDKIMSEISTNSLISTDPIHHTQDKIKYLEIISFKRCHVYSHFLHPFCLKTKTKSL